MECAIDERKEDRLSSLPDHILVNILSFLPLKSMVVTSALSSRWCHVWTQITDVLINDNFYPGEDWDVLDVVDDLLAQLTMIREFKFKSHYILDDSDDQNRNFSAMDSWLRLLCDRNVEKIQLFCDLNTIHNVVFPLPPPCIFQTKSLVVLELGREISCSLPEDGEFNLPNLKKLRIVLPACSCALISKLIKSCPVLEYLNLRFGLVPMNEPTIVDISCRNLETLYCLYMLPDPPLHSAKFIFDAPKLTKLRINVTNPLSFCFLNNPMRLNAAGILVEGSFDRISLLKDVFGASGNVQKLQLNAYGDNPPILRHSPSTLFPNLTLLRFWVSCSTHFKELIALLQFCPALQSLYVPLCDENENENEMRWIPPPSGSALVLTHLKSIKITEFESFRTLVKKPWLNLVRYLLSSAPVLERLTVDCPNIDQRAELVVRNILLYECQKNSLCCEIKFRGKLLKQQGS